MKEVVALGMSGGIDSSMALKYLLKEYDTVVGANHVVWHGVQCSDPQVIARARELCERMSVPFYCIDVSCRFRKQVADRFISDYLSGKTPNPCVVCNETIKFTYFYDRLREMLENDGIITGGDTLLYATGHYAGIVEKEGRLFISKAKDLRKDQSYMLYRLPQELLGRIRFPLGDLLKKDITLEAEEDGLEYSNVKESQDICFIEGSYGDFISSYTGRKFRPGKIVDMQGNYLGKHRGYIHYTIGQRKGLGLGNGPWFVTSVNPETNIVTVGRENEQGQKTFVVSDLNWFIDFDGRETEAVVRVRYNSGEHPCRFRALDEDKVLVTLEKDTVITGGQSAVFYQGDLVIGGGIIS